LPTASKRLFALALKLKVNVLKYLSFIVSNYAKQWLPKIQMIAAFLVLLHSVMMRKSQSWMCVLA